MTIKIVDLSAAVAQSLHKCEAEKKSLAADRDRIARERDEARQFLFRLCGLCDSMFEGRSYPWSNRAVDAVAQRLSAVDDLESERDEALADRDAILDAIEEKDGAEERTFAARLIKAERTLADCYQAVGMLGETMDLSENEDFIRLQDNAVRSMGLGRNRTPIEVRAHRPSSPHLASP